LFFMLKNVKIINFFLSKQDKKINKKLVKNSSNS